MFNARITPTILYQRQIWRTLWMNPQLELILDLLQLHGGTIFITQSRSFCSIKDRGNYVTTVEVELPPHLKALRSQGKIRPNKHSSGHRNGSASQEIPQIVEDEVYEV